MIARQLVKYLSISTIGNWAQDSTTTERKPHTVKVNGGDFFFDGVDIYYGGGNGRMEAWLSHSPIR